MTRIEGETVIARPLDEVFDFVADERNEPTFNRHMLSAEKLTDGPVGTGTEFLASTRALGRPVTMLIEITEYERPRRLRSTTHMPSADVRGQVTFRSEGAGTRLHWSWEVEPKGVARFAGPLVGRLGGRHEQETWASLKQCLEQNGHR